MQETVSVSRREWTTQTSVDLPFALSVEGVKYRPTVEQCVADISHEREVGRYATLFDGDTPADVCHTTGVYGGATTHDYRSDFTMTLRETDLDVESVMQVRDRSLEDAYEVHDEAQDMLEQRVEEGPYQTVQHGDEAPEAEEIYFGDGPDIAVYPQGQDPENTDPLAYVEVKSKEWRDGDGAEWFCRCNRRHWNHYVNFAKQTDVPTYVYFALMDTEQVFLRREAFVEVTDREQYEGDVTDLSEKEELLVKEEDIDFDYNGAGAGMDLVSIDPEDIFGISRGTQLVNGIPEVWGNSVVSLDETDCRSFGHFLNELQRRS